jgi:hypothetical protein
MGVALLLVVALSYPLLYAYFRWDDERVIRSYGGTVASGQRASDFIAEYLNQRLRSGMRPEEVRAVIGRYVRSEMHPEGERTESELFLLDPLETLRVQVVYEDGRLIPGVMADRYWGKDLLILLALLLMGFLCLLVSFLPLEQPQRRVE